jgi:hypothetical protein
MKKALFLILALAFAISMAGTVVEYFTAQSQNDNVVIRWKTSDETGVQKFVLERGVNQSSEFANLLKFHQRVATQSTNILTHPPLNRQITSTFTDSKS